MVASDKGYTERGSGASADSGAGENGHPTLRDIAATVTTLEPFGEHWWKGDCPLCGEQASSLTIFPNREAEEAFRCDSCGAEGDVGDFLKALYFPPTDRGFNLTDQGNAERLVHRHGENLRYVYAWGKWLVWDGKRWIKDDTGEVFRLAKRRWRASTGKPQPPPTRERARP